MVCCQGNATSLPSLAQLQAATAGQGLRQRLAASAAALHLATCALCAVPITAAGPAEAVLQSPNALIARTVDAALRRAIPASNSDVQQIQTKLEVGARIASRPSADVSSCLPLTPTVCPRPKGVQCAMLHLAMSLRS